jgi:hypothetical protein
MNLAEINQEQALNLVRFFIRSNQNIFLFGKSGIGKSHIGFQAIKDCGLKTAYVNLSVIERPDLIGYPDLNSPGDVIRYKSPNFLPFLEEGKKPDTVIVFDEVDKAERETTSPLLEILQFKTINGRPLNVVGCILTGNLLNEGAFANQISTAILDRGAKYCLQFSFEKWLNWAKLNGIHDLVLGFLSTNPQLTCGDVETTFYASPSPRGWHYVSDALYKAKQLKIADIETITHIVSGFVGYEAAIKFKIWFEHFRKFEPFIHSIIETGNCILDLSTLTPTEKIVFTISSCAISKQKFVQETKNKPKYQYVENLCRFLSKSDIDLETQALGLSNSFPLEFVADKRYRLYNCADFFNLTSKLNIK